MQKESRKEIRERNAKEARDLAKNRIKFECYGLDFFGMKRFADMGAEIVCIKGKDCRHECEFRRFYYGTGKVVRGK